MRVPIFIAVASRLARSGKHARGRMDLATDQRGRPVLRGDRARRRYRFGGGSGAPL
jgi:hypothetical protein